MRLPFPAHNLKPQPCPPDALPARGRREGAWAENTLLRDAAVRLFDGRVDGSESVAVAPDGALWMLDKFGYVHVAAPAPAGAEEEYVLGDEPVCYVGPGRPLGFHFDGAGDLLICCSSKGLCRLERGALALSVLCNHAGGRPVNYANDLDVDPATGRVFFTDSTVIPPALNAARPRPWYDTMRSFLLAQAHGAPTGRLLAWDPASRRADVLLDGLYYANGVALSADGAFVAVVETCAKRVRRHWLRGAAAGTADVLVGGAGSPLPGYPDNIVRAADGNFWLCLVVPDAPAAHALAPRPWARGLAAAAMRYVAPPLGRWGCVAKVSPAGKVLQVLMDPGGAANRVSSCSSVTEHNNRLFIGSLANAYVSYVDLDKLPPVPPAA